MKTIKLWRVKHHTDDRGGHFNFRYAASEDVANEMAKMPWGFCGAPGEAEEVELSVYEATQEVLNESR